MHKAWWVQAVTAKPNDSPKRNFNVKNLKLHKTFYLNCQRKSANKSILKFFTRILFKTGPVSVQMEVQEKFSNLLSIKLAQARDFSSMEGDGSFFKLVQPQKINKCQWMSKRFKIHLYLHVLLNRSSIGHAACHIWNTWNCITLMFWFRFYLKAKINPTLYKKNMINLGKPERLVTLHIGYMIESGNTATSCTALILTQLKQLDHSDLLKRWTIELI